ncbi:MAG: MFS transporter [Pseudonocardia sp.]|nr:MFS transporter [Pseudonocardia sp.]
MTTADLRPPEIGPTGPGDGDQPDSRRWIAFLIMTVATFMDLLDATIVNVALSEIQADLGLGFVEIQWLTAGYVLAFALTLITGGRLGDIVGRRLAFLVGVGGFTVASLICGLATDPTILIGARIMQGAMAGLMVPQVLSIIHVTFPPKEKGTVFAINGTVAGLAAVAAPVIGGLLVAADVFGWGWRAIFLVNVPIGVAGVLLGLRFIPESRAATALKLDLVGVVLSAVGLLLLVLPLTMGRELGWPVWGYGSMLLGVLVLGGFVAYEQRVQRRGGSPLVALDLFRARSFSAGTALTLTFFAFTGMFMLVLYLYLQLGLGWSSLHAGLSVLPFAFGAFVTAAASVMTLVPRYGRIVLQIGAAVMAAGLVVFLATNALAGATASTWTLVPALFVIGLGFGAATTPIGMFALSDVPKADAGSASGVINTMMQLGLALGIAIASVSFFTPLGDANDGASYSAALQVMLWTGLALVLAALAMAGALPRRMSEDAVH